VRLDVAAWFFRLGGLTLGVRGDPLSAAGLGALAGLVAGTAAGALGLLVRPSGRYRVPEGRWPGAATPGGG
ncbi:hypothetical protein ACFQ0D_32695, partial [Micromonospora zhanjiangensis]